MSGVLNSRGFRAIALLIALNLILNSVALAIGTYNGCGDVTKYTSPLTGGSAYDIDYVYDDAGRLTTVDYDSGTDTTFTYDDAGRRTQMVDSSGTTAWTYNDASQVTHFDSPQGDVDYEYWDDGQIKKADDDASGDFTYVYSSTTGQLTSLTNPYSEVTSFVYDNLGRLEKKTFHSGQYEQFTYDDRDRVTDIDLKNSSHSVLLAQEYTYDDASNVLTHKKDSVTTTYTYDYINQLLSEDRGSYSCNYTYDANGNRLTRTLGTTTEDYVCDNADKLTEIKIGSTTIKSFSYDAAGRTTGITYSGSTTTLAYDYESRVTSITRSGVTTNTNSYNGLDTRYSAVDSTGTKTFKRAGAGVLAPVLGDGSAVYTPGISERRSSTTTYSHPGIKSGEAQSSTSQVIAATRQYDAFGSLDSSTGTWKGPFGYGGAFGYQETGDHGLRLLGHRYYDSSTGRFLTRDVTYDGRNWYAYCENNPLSATDPEGTEKIKLPAKPGGLPPGWWRDNEHNPPGGGGRWYPPGANKNVDEGLEFHPRKPRDGGKGRTWKEKDHWHKVLPGEHGPQTDDEHHLPGDEVDVRTPDERTESYWRNRDGKLQGDPVFNYRLVYEGNWLWGPPPGWRWRAFPSSGQIAWKSR